MSPSDAAVYDNKQGTRAEAFLYDALGRDSFWRGKSASDMSEILNLSSYRSFEVSPLYRVYLLPWHAVQDAVPPLILCDKVRFSCEQIGRSDCTVQWIPLDEIAAPDVIPGDLQAETGDLTVGRDFATDAVDSSITIEPAIVSYLGRRYSKFLQSCVRNTAIVDAIKSYAEDPSSLRFIQQDLTDSAGGADGLNHQPEVSRSMSSFSLSSEKSGDAETETMPRKRYKSQNRKVRIPKCVDSLMKEAYENLQSSRHSSLHG